MKLYFFYLLIICSVNTLFGMELSPREQIAKAKSAFEKECALHSQHGCNYHSCTDKKKIGDRYYTTLATIVKNAGNKLTNQEKLTYLVGDPYYEERKTIIKEMIETENIDPNTIKISQDRHPFYECYFQEDDQFARYLLAHGASTKALPKAVGGSHTDKVIIFINQIINQQK